MIIFNLAPLPISEDSPTKNYKGFAIYPEDEEDEESLWLFLESNGQIKDMPKLEMNEDNEIKNLIGKPYFENRHKLKYGGTVDSKGLIREALTKSEIEKCARKCQKKYIVDDA